MSHKAENACMLAKRCICEFEVSKFRNSAPAVSKLHIAEKTPKVPLVFSVPLQHKKFHKVRDARRGTHTNLQGRFYTGNRKGKVMT